MIEAFMVWKRIWNKSSVKLLVLHLGQPYEDNSLTEWVDPTRHWLRSPWYNRPSVFILCDEFCYTSKMSQRYSSFDWFKCVKKNVLRKTAVRGRMTRRPLSGWRSDPSALSALLRSAESSGTPHKPVAEQTPKYFRKRKPLPHKIFSQFLIECFWQS